LSHLLDPLVHALSPKVQSADQLSALDPIADIFTAEVAYAEGGRLRRSYHSAHTERTARSAAFRYVVNTGIRGFRITVDRWNPLEAQGETLG